MKDLYLIIFYSFIIISIILTIIILHFFTNIFNNSIYYTLYLIFIPITLILSKILYNKIKLYKNCSSNEITGSLDEQFLKDLNITFNEQDLQKKFNVIINKINTQKLEQENKIKSIENDLNNILNSLEKYIPINRNNKLSIITQQIEKYSTNNLNYTQQTLDPYYQYYIYTYIIPSYQNYITNVMYDYSENSRDQPTPRACRAQVM